MIKQFEKWSHIFLANVLLWIKYVQPQIWAILKERNVSLCSTLRYAFKVQDVVISPKGEKIIIIYWSITFSSLPFIKFNRNNKFTHVVVTSSCIKFCCSRCRLYATFYNHMETVAVALKPEMNLEIIVKVFILPWKQVHITGFRMTQKFKPYSIQNKT